MPPSYLLIGEEGRTYEYACFPKDTAWDDVAGCYAFAKVTICGLPEVLVTTILYIGQTESFRKRLTENDDQTWADIASPDTNYVLTRAVPDEPDRLTEMQEMIATYRPRLNVQQRQDLTNATAR